MVWDLEFIKTEEEGFCFVNNHGGCMYLKQHNRKTLALCDDAFDVSFPDKLSLQAFDKLFNRTTIVTTY